MTQSISLRRTGLVVFAARIASIFTGLLFLIMMTRTLSAEQFGLWEVIIDLVAFASYPAGLITFWATRDIARGKMLGKTAIAMNLLLSTGGVLLYFVFSFLTAGRIGADVTTLFLAVLLVPIGYWNQAANAVVSGHNPVVLGYAVIASEIAKIAVAYPALIIFKVGIDGVILAIMVANFAQAAASTLLADTAVSAPIDIDAGKRWFATVWLPAITTAPYVIGLADTYVASLAAGQTGIVGYYQAAFSIAQIAGYSVYLAAAMYPLLLRGGADEVASSTMELALVFGIPMAVGPAVLAKPILYLLKPQYVDASTALVILCFTSLGITVSYVLDQTLFGKEKVDVNESARFHDYLHSNLIFVAVLNITLTVSYLALVYATITFGISSSLPLAATLDLWALSQLIVVVVFSAMKIWKVTRIGKYPVHRKVWIYILGAGLMALVLEGLQSLITLKAGTFVLAIELFALSVVALVVYAGFVLSLDTQLRGLVLRTIKRTFG